MSVLTNISAQTTQMFSSTPLSVDEMEYRRCDDFIRQYCMTYLNIQRGHLSFCGNFTAVKRLPPIPSSVQSINLNFMNSLEVLPAFHSNIKSIEASLPACKRIEGFAEGLESLTITTSLPSLPTLPSTLTYLNCSWSKFTEWPVLHEGLTHFIANRVKGLRSCPPLPSTLVYLDLSNTDIESLPDQLPPHLSTLIINNTPITRLPSLPNNILSISIMNTRIRDLPVLPESLHILNVTDSLVNILPNIPRSLSTITGLEHKCPSSKQYYQASAKWWQRKEEWRIKQRCSIIKDELLKKVGNPIQELTPSSSSSSNINKNNGSYSTNTFFK